MFSMLLLAALGSSSAFARDPLQSALEYNRTGQATTWVNPDTGGSGAVAPVRTFEDAAGQPCREFRQTILIGGRQEQGYGTACRQPDGAWRIVAGEAAAAAPVARRTSVYVREVPRPYYYPAYYPYGYYDPWWYGYPLSLSLSFGYVSGGGHHHHRHSGRHDGGHRFRGHRR
jgi:hypothetical protein